MTQAPEARAAFHARVTDLFLATADLSAEERVAFLERTCGSDGALRAAVERMLAGDRPGSDFLAPAPRGDGPEPAPRQVGAYRLLRVLGSGGMGTVWLAERVDGQFQKRVALKLVKRGMDTEAVVRRFRVERQVLADLEHPRIARLLDGGTTEEGVPYLVMELVEGRPLLSYCTEERLGVDERLRLFQKICETVHYAHQRKVVHRDLKPGNVLVASDGEPKLLDFGIAKVLELGTDAATLELTHTGERFLSPRYASPEQLRGEPVGPVSDVYALGVILYELLTALHPHGWTTTSWREFELEVLECPAQPPSRAILARGDSERPAEGRRARSRRLRGDLDTIVLTALRKEPERRYASVQSLALDIGRHLAGHPIHARPDTLPYRASKFVRRNRALVIGTGAFVLLLLVALGISLTLYAGSLRSASLANWEAYVGHVAAAENALANGRVAEARMHLEQTPASLRDWEWHHLRTRLDGARRTLETSTEGAFALDPARRRLAVGQGRTIELRDLETLEVLLTTETAGPHVRGTWKGCVDLAFSPDGRRIASAWHGGGFAVHDLEAGGRLVTRGEPDVRYTTVAFHPSRDRLVVGAKDGSLRELDPASGAQRALRAEHAQEITALAFDASGRFLASGSWDESVRIWEADALTPLLELRGHGMAINSVSFAPDGSRLVSASLDGTVRVWDVATGDALHVHHLEGGFDGAALFHPDGASLLVALRGGIAVFDVQTRKRRALWLGHEYPPTRLVLDVSRGRAWSKGGHDLKEWSLDTQDVRTLPACEYSHALGFDPRGGRFAYAGPDRRIRLWTWPAGESLGELASARGKLMGLRFHPSEERLFALDEHGALSIWHPGERRELHVEEPRSDVAPLVPLDLSGDDAGELLACFLGSVIELRSAAGDLLHSLVPPEGVRLQAARIDPRGRLVGAVDAVGRTLVWDAHSATLQADLPLPDAVVGAGRAVGFDPRGELLAVGLDEGTIVLWRPRSGELQAVLTECHSRIDSLAFHPDGKRLASGSLDGTIRLWDVPTGRLVATLTGHAVRVAGLAFSPDGSGLVSVSDDASARLWQVPTTP